ncbi:MAG: TlpA family protein disulfide reductase [Pseudomonadales bacterium]|jgi:thiol-disulfide isomerase/thioredoxin
MPQFFSMQEPLVRASTRAPGLGWVLALGLLLLAGCSRAELELADGSRASFDDWKGRWVVINYWAEWCAPCREEMPELNALHRAGGDHVVVLGVNYDGVSRAELERLIDLFDIEFPLLLADPGPRFNQPLPSVVPTTLIIDPAGALRTVLIGPQSFDDLADVVELPATLRPTVPAAKDAAPSAAEPLSA